jgi:hypothetical protein
MTLECTLNRVAFSEPAGLEVVSGDVVIQNLEYT